jgi:hypothetical protein
LHGSARLANRQPFMVVPARGATIRGEPTLLRKLQAAKKETARDPVPVNKVASDVCECARERLYQSSVRLPPTHHRFGGQKLNATILGSSSSNVTSPISGPPNVNGFDPTHETLCDAYDALAQHTFRGLSDSVDLPEVRVFIASWVDYCRNDGVRTAGNAGAVLQWSTIIVTLSGREAARCGQVPGGSAYG